jgi:hypothetical protein
MDNKVDHFFDKDLQHLIYSKIYYKQPKDLLDDIVNYHKSYNLIITKYKKHCLIDDFDYSDDFNLYVWLENDLCAFFNDNLDSYNIISLNNIKKIKRLKITNTKKFKDLMHSFHLSFNIDIKTRVNRYIACLTIAERKLFMN